MAFNPVLLASMSDVEPSESGLASGIVNTSFMMGGSLGLAVLASLLQPAGDTWRHLASTVLPRYVGNTAALLALVAAGVISIVGGSRATDEMAL